MINIADNIFVQTTTTRYFLYSKSQMGVNRFNREMGRGGTGRGGLTSFDFG